MTETGRLKISRKLWLKVAHEVNLKLAFMEWFFFKLVILIMLCKIRYLNLDKALSSAICLKNWKLWRASTTTKFHIFCWSFAHVSYLTGFFILFTSRVNNENIHNKCVETRSFFIFANSSRSKQNNNNKKNPEHLFLDIGK